MRDSRWRGALACVVTSVVLAVPVAAAAQDTGVGAEAVKDDIGSYADEIGISRSEAVSRFGLQSAAGDLDAILTDSAGEVFAGLWIVHEPQFEVIVWLTDLSVDISQAVDDVGLSGYVEVRKAARSLEELETDAARFLRDAGPGTRPFDLTIDVPSNEIRIEVESLAVLFDFLDQRGVALPSDSSVQLIGQLAEPSANIYGGLALSSCTTGFSVKNSAGTKGVVTAGHCDNSQSYLGTSLPYVAGATVGSNDEQWHTAPGFTVRNWATDGVNDATPYYRLITGTTSRSNQALNSYYCKYGKVTGYNCGYLISKTRAPGYIPNVNATFMELEKSGVNLCSGGDSGGPEYSGASALGITSGCAGSGGISNIFYTAINYVTGGLSVTVLTS